MELSTPPQLLLVEKQKQFQSEENLSEIWHLAQNLVGGNEKLRFQALEGLKRLEVIRYSPLLTYMVTTRLSDSEINIRQLAILVVNSILGPDLIGNLAAEEVILQIHTYFLNISEFSVRKLLMASKGNLENRAEISKLLNLCPRTGRHLASILADRNETIECRRLAADFIGLIGYMETKPILIRIKNRIESSLNNKNRIPIVTEVREEQKNLLLSINTALTLLQTP